MPYSAEIPITNNNDCTTNYIVQYKKSTESTYVSVPAVMQGDSIILAPLDDATTYNVMIAKLCCNGQYSLSTSVNITTT